MRIGAVLLAALVACGRDAAVTGAGPVAVPHPPGTALAIDGRAVARDEVDALARTIARLYPAATANEHRRAALVSLVLEREALGSRFPDGRREALARATDELARLRAGQGTCAPVRGVGGPLGVGLATWCGLIDAPLGEWRGPFEERGTTVVARRIPIAEAAPEADPEGHGEFALGVEGCHWDWGEQPTREVIEDALDRARLEIVDPAYRELVPIDLRYRLGAEAP